MKRTCFVLMPFGKKKDPTSDRVVDFDALYTGAIRPAIEDAGLDPIRADAEVQGGLIHKAMLERLLISDFAVADLTFGNANVFYELGLRHGVRPRSTLLLFEGGYRLPFDVLPLRALPYSWDPSTPDPTRAAIRAAAERMIQADGEDGVDSPLYQLVHGLEPMALPHQVTDLFQAASEAEDFGHRLAAARAQGADALRALEDSLGDPALAAPTALVALLLAWRHISAFAEMVRLCDTLPASVRQLRMVQEQYGFALNRIGEKEKAERILTSIIERYGHDPETSGLLGRIHKDRWSALRDSSPFAAAGHLRKAIDTYLAGFRADPRDAYPGINALTLLLTEGSSSSLDRHRRLLPVVRFAVERKVSLGTPDYWDHATLLELAVHERDPAAAQLHLADALASPIESFGPKSTADQLARMGDLFAARGEPLPWLDEVVAALRAA